MRRRFNSYKMYADATIKEVFTADELSKAAKLTVNEINTLVYINTVNGFKATALPTEAQFAPATQIKTGDFDHDGNIDILLFGNRSDNRLKIGSIDANYGCMLKGDGRGGFSFVEQGISGLSVKGDVKSVVETKINGVPYIVLGLADGPLQFYKQK